MHLDIRYQDLTQDPALEREMSDMLATLAAAAGISAAMVGLSRGAEADSGYRAQIDATLPGDRVVVDVEDRTPARAFLRGVAMLERDLRRFALLRARADLALPV